jgi:hypothetical protein
LGSITQCCAISTQEDTTAGCNCLRLARSSRSCCCEARAGQSSCPLRGATCSMQHTSGVGVLLDVFHSVAHARLLCALLYARLGAQTGSMLPRCVPPPPPARSCQAVLLLAQAAAMLPTMTAAKRALRAFWQAWSQVNALPDGDMATPNALSAPPPLVHPKGPACWHDAVCNALTHLSQPSPAALRHVCCCLS